MRILENVLFSCFTIIWCSNILLAQCPEGVVYLDSQADVDNFPVLYPDCTEISNNFNIGIFSVANPNGISDITDLTPLSQITTIEGFLRIERNNGLINLSGLDNLALVGGFLSITDNANLINLNGLNNLTSFESNIYINRNTNLIDLDGLDNITSAIGVYIRDNPNLTSLNSLNNLISAQSVIIDNNGSLVNFNGLSNLTSIESNLRITDNNNLSTLNGLYNLTFVGNSLYITYNPNLLIFNGLDSLASVGGGLWIYGNTNLTTLTGLENLVSTSTGLGIRNNSSLASLNGLENLTSVGGDLWIYDNINLTTLDGLNSLTSIEDTLEVINNPNLNSLSDLGNINNIPEVKIYDNPLLSICGVSPVCNNILNGGYNEIHNNAPGCNDIMEIAITCSFGIIQTNIFYDLNQNQIQDVNEPNYYDFPILIGNDLFYPQSEGLIFLELGTYTAVFDEASNPNWQLTTTPASYSLNLEAGEIETITFGIYPTQQISDIQSIINAPPARCNESIFFDVSTKNLGTTAASGTVWLTIDNESPVDSFIHQPDTMITNANTYGWHFTDLFPSQSIEKQVNIQVPGPPDFMLGDSLLFETHVDFEDANGGQSTQAFIYETEVRCSFDPNDKLVNPNREGDYVLFEEDFIYTIRFQNTGNDVAYDVVIRDTLDANLDLTTFRLLGSSHANRLNTILDDDERTLTFEFRDIFLPDSTSNFDASQGYVNYLISPFDGLAEETPITNSAGIYFDLNPPVITNTTQSIMVSELPTVAIENPDNSFNFNILPNPNTGIFRVQNIPTGVYQIHNTSGQIIREGNIQNDLQIDISSEAQGVYFISITVDDATAVRRIVKM